MTPKKVDKEARRRDIYKSAMELFAQKGVPGTTIQDIATRAGIGKGTIYEYFNSKDEILSASFQYILDDLQQNLAIEEKETKEPAARLYAFFDNLIGYMENLPANITEMLLVFWAEGILNNPSNSDRIHSGGIDLRNMYREYVKYLVPIVEQGKQQGDFKAEINSSALVSSLIGATDGILLQWVIFKGQYDLRTNMNELLQVTLAGIKK